MTAIPAYTYPKLDEAKQEIRLLTLLPSPHLNDPIRMTISNVSFTVKEKETPPPVDINAIASDLPEGWYAHENIEGRVLYTLWDDENRCWTNACWEWKSPAFRDKIKRFKKRFKSSRMKFKPRERGTDGSELKFEALSYTWGSDADPEIAYVVSQAKGVKRLATKEAQERTLEIKQNLAVALKHLRYVNRPRTLWVDAICINQADVEERNEQVLRMKDLYKHADHVVVWLGPSASDSAEALSAMEHIGKQVDYGCDCALLPSPDATEENWANSRGGLPYDDDTFQAIHDVISRPWFERVWVVQEIQLAGRRALIQCGKDNIEWCYFRRAVLCLGVGVHHAPENLLERVGKLRDMCNTVMGWPVPHLLTMNTARKCVNPLDKIYGILALAPDVVRSTIVPDYTLSTIEGYKATFLKFTSLTRRLELLDHCDGHPPGSDWPSWLADWSTQNEERDYFYLELRTSGDSAAHWNYVEPNILELTGAQLSKVDRIAQWTFKPGGDVSELLEEVGIENLKNLKYPTGETLIDAYAHVLHRGQFNDEVMNANIPYYSTLPEARRMILENAANSYRDEYLMDYYLKWLKGRRLIHTAEGYIGTAPGDVQIGDIICVVLGCHLPLILRKNPSDSTYKFVGHSYLYGLVNGEGLLGPVPEPWIPKRAMNDRGFWRQRFYNPETNIAVDLRADPRLGPLPVEWEPLENDDPHRIQKWMNKETGEIINSDPRLLPKALLEQGVKLETFALT